ncbi:MAG: AbrB/MazE/SpoVT family DNA-binding domain-containing protein [Patescibacteria group bacterium]|nr:AbrB/MazE/SpoVT family DNA-binding domain-containing protein [Patescibacteria group bacterium]
MTKKDEHPTCPMFIGSTTMGERGQVVIPKEIRKIYNLKKGDQFVAVVSHQDAIALIPMSKAKVMLKHMTEQLDNIINNK